MTKDKQAAMLQARLKKRYRAEKRFKAYGLTAVLFAAVFLCFLLGDIINKSLPAFTTHWFEVKVNIAKKDAEKDGVISNASIQAMDLQTPARDALQAYFPHVEGRTEKRALNSLLSSGSTTVFRNQLLADHSLIGRDITAPILFSDDADLYLKGKVTAVSTEKAQGVARLTVTGDKAVIASSQPDFQSEIEAFKRNLDIQAENLGLEITRLETALADIEQAEAKATLQQRIDGFKTEQAALMARASTQEGSEPLGIRDPSVLVYINGGIIKLTSISASQAEGTIVQPLVETVTENIADWSIQVLETPEGNRRLNDQSVVWLEHLKAQNTVVEKFSWEFFTTGDSREPEQAGILGALIGSLITMGVTLVLCLPIGVAAAIYLEEFAPKNRWTDLIEVNINNLAAVPSIVFGLLGLSIFLNFFNLPRSAPLVGGLVLALLVLPTIIIASRAALRAVPPSIREAALGIGASKQQAVFHHVLPLAMPGIMTGTIISMAHALGETAPLLLIGMVAFIVDVPQGITAAATVLPVQIYLWSDLPEVAFQAKTAAAILVLLFVLFVMNAVAVILRRRFERRW